MSRPAVLIGVCALTLAACSGASKPAPAPRSSPAQQLTAYRDTVVVPAGRPTHVNGFGTASFVSATASTCTFRWQTEHPFGWKGSAVATVRVPVTLHAFRDAVLTLTRAGTDGCTFDEYLPAQPFNTASPPQP